MTNFISDMQMDRLLVGEEVLLAEVCFVAAGALVGSLTAVGPRVSLVCGERVKPYKHQTHKLA